MLCFKPLGFCRRFLIKIKNRNFIQNNYNKVYLLLIITAKIPIYLYFKNSRLPTYNFSVHITCS